MDASAHRPDIEIPDDLQTVLDTYKTEQEALRQELRGLIDDLEDPSDEDIGAVREAFKDDNVDRIDAQKELRADIRDAFQDLRDENVSTGSGVDPEVQALRTQFRDGRKALREDRQELEATLAAAAEEDREQIRADFLEDHQLDIDALKDLRRSLRDAVKDVANLDGDDRPED